MAGESNSPAILFFRQMIKRKAKRLLFCFVKTACFVGENLAYFIHPDKSFQIRRVLT